jgi:rubrerythrin
MSNIKDNLQTSIAGKSEENYKYLSFAEMVQW